MYRRDFLKSMGITAGSFFLAGPRQRLEASPVKAKKPNFLFILVDDLGWADLGCYGSDFYETPNVDRLAKQGMRFTDAYVDPVCSPTRIQIMSGKYPARLDTTTFFGAPQPERFSKPREQLGWWERQMYNLPLLPASHRGYMPLEEKSLGSAFKEAGYATFFAGKWHLGPEGYWPEDHGFEINKGGHQAGAPFGAGYFSPYDNPRLEDGPEGEYLPYRLASETKKFMASETTGGLASETNNFIEGVKDKPFLAFLSFYLVHTPLEAKEELEKKYIKKKQNMGLETKWGQISRWGVKDEKVRLTQDHAVYAGMVEALDNAVGMVLDKLDELEISDNTAVFFVSDNGGLSTSEGHPTSNFPLRAGKGWLYEGGVRVPLIVRWPNTIEAGSICDEPVIGMDFYPTMLEMADLPMDPTQHKDGKSLLPLLKGQKMERGPLFWHYPHYSFQGGPPSGAVRDGDWKLIQFFDSGKIELYNLKCDIEEKNNLVDRNPDKAEELLEKLIEFRRQTDAKMPEVNSNYRMG